jgi:hypothetical protein
MMPERRTDKYKNSLDHDGGDLWTSKSAVNSRCFYF